MKALTAIFLFFFTTHITFGQQKKGRVSISANYGLTGNFFVRSYDEQNGPTDKQYFYKKNFIGSAAGLAVTFQVSENSGLFLEYSRTINTGKKSYEGSLNSTSVMIEDFRLRHVNNFFQLGYVRNFKMANAFIQAQAGVFMLTDQKQLISIERWDNLISISETNAENSGSKEAGVFLGGEYSFKLDTKVDFGIRTRGYFLVSTGTFEALTLTPVLRYNF
ncbi:hypothetical protein [Parasegetibacter sp. NRK P23]|uniref:hypothetical protein n=1 Tax=Parasegetibacter sp. NRK P23 TaxID=2942999 RepID=UPI002042EFB9|nr:hypothetical protein [Parasegetibacter sp. NRK P23]MCM5529933.1 hypothetical protein [Parasegetibacter sp. NRK P23]